MSFCDCFQVQISAYLDNVFDVAALMEDSETKTAALEKVAELEEELGHVSSIPMFFCLFQALLVLNYYIGKLLWLSAVG